jgi:hypothetical protein
MAEQRYEITQPAQQYVIGRQKKRQLRLHVGMRKLSFPYVTVKAGSFSKQ